MLPVGSIVALAASAGSRPSARTFAADLGLALLLVAAFRVWDDLADRGRDGGTHPERVLVRARSVRPAVLLCVALGAAAAAWIATRDGAALALALLLALGGCAAWWYARRGPRTTFGDHLLLAKYPLFVVIVAGARLAAHPGRVLLAAAVVYLGACVYETWHDRATPAAASRLLVASEALLLVVLLAALSIGGRP
jgi:4-hydroxybenzoate polyprenyltransferase